MSNQELFVLLLAFLAVSGVSASEPQLRDPTIPLGYSIQQSAAKPLMLQAILDRNGKKTAVINGKRLSSGQVIEGAVIVSISNKEVYFRRNGKSGALVLRPSIR